MNCLNQKQSLASASPAVTILIVTTTRGFHICVGDENHENIEAYVLSELESYILWQDQRPTRDIEALRADISCMASGVFSDGYKAVQ